MRTAPRGAAGPPGEDTVFGPAPEVRLFLFFSLHVGRGKDLQGTGLGGGSHPSGRQAHLLTAGRAPPLYAAECRPGHALFCCFFAQRAGAVPVRFLFSLHCSGQLIRDAGLSGTCSSPLKGRRETPNTADEMRHVRTGLRSHGELHQRSPSFIT
ncbi:hypothetical protein NDU88_008942 [Pleurodeles waltl]|uniref:Uncharacterized protein n=1 Tax=Pleurodeles waltl TaxID=8319 RepID=A0AAV7P523_PLEWA|nr:hypothetical protein NDU88_008942 [Pleurodeles waltl]